MALPHRIGFIGAGNMATAIARGLVATGAASAERLSFAEPDAERRDAIQREVGGTVGDDNGAVARSADVLVLATKPQVFGAVLPELADAIRPETLVVSIAAGISTAIIERAMPNGTRVVRTMPNTPALVGAGATAIAAGTHATADDLGVARAMFEAVGAVVEVEEGLLDAVTGLSGSGPAYVFAFVEALTAAGEKAGLDAEVSAALAAQTVWGAAKLLTESGESPAVLRERVTSPGGTTLAGLQAMAAAGFAEAVAKTVQAATDRSVELREEAESKG